MIIKEITDIFTVYGSFARVYGEVGTNDNIAFYKNEDIALGTKTVSHPSGVYERIDSIKNISQRNIEITTLLSKFTLNGGEYLVYSETSKHIRECMGNWQPLVSGVYGCSDELRTNQVVSPFVAVYNEQNGRGYAFHIMCDSMFEYRVSRHGDFLSPRVVTVELGIKSDNLNYVLKPGEVFELPHILYYEFRSRLDLDAYKLHRFMNERRPSSLPVIYNTWMSNFDSVDYIDLVRQLSRAKSIGCEYFTVDAGWFGITQQWWESVGDWQESENSSLRGKMSDLAELVRKSGLKFGLWFEIERASRECNNARSLPNYYIIDGGSAYLDFSSKEARNFIYRVLKKNIDKYGVEFLKFDLNGVLAFDRHRTSFIEYYKGYNQFLAQIREDYPNMHIECCASGGGRMSLSNAYSFDSFWMSDNHGIYAQLDIFKNAIKRMPSRMLERWATIRSLEDFSPTYPVGGSTEKILLSADANWGRVEEASIDFIKNALVGGPIGISCDLTKVSDSTLHELSAFIKEYKASRDFYAMSECHILCDTPSLLVLQFNDKDYSDIRIFSYTVHPDQDKVCIYPFIEENQDTRYAVIRKNGDRVWTNGYELDKCGIELDASKLRTSDSVMLKRG